MSENHTFTRDVRNNFYLAEFSKVKNLKSKL